MFSVHHRGALHGPEKWKSASEASGLNYYFCPHRFQYILHLQETWAYRVKIQRIIARYWDALLSLWKCSATKMLQFRVEIGFECDSGQQVSSQPDSHMGNCVCVAEGCLQHTQHSYLDCEKINLSGCLFLVFSFFQKLSEMPTNMYLLAFCQAVSNTCIACVRRQCAGLFVLWIGLLLFHSAVGLHSCLSFLNDELVWDRSTFSL